MVIDLDETLIHSVLDGMSRQTTGSASPPDFVLKMDVDHHPVRFSVHKRPHVDYFLNIVSRLSSCPVCWIRLTTHSFTKIARLLMYRNYRLPSHTLVNLLLNCLS
ncbi:unnamed protein product [Hydatigera taeniaeformis]|uniref:FCP1 homology domain-containing protein n=1 Tax=Hydatigena taeniaeformis TaxID=6205 RepID=A0A0R3WWV6_HYDTA|nr:unnamed protein product [Hydatigera taeniaeformis]